MSQNIKNNSWKKWFPGEITELKNVIRKKVVKLQAHDDKEVDSITVTNQRKNCDNKSKKLDQNYNNGFKQGIKEGFIAGLKQSSLEFEKKNNEILNKMNNVLSNFEYSLSLFDKNISSYLLNTVLKVSKKVIECVSIRDNERLIKKINNIFKKYMFSLDHPKLFINSEDQILIKNYFSRLFCKYKWTIVCDDNIPPGEFIVSLGDTILNSTSSVRWNTLCRLIYSKEE